MTDLTATIRPAREAIPGLDAMTLAAVLGLGAIGLWASILVREWPRFTALGRICGDEGAVFGHCALCAPALALTAGALFALAAAARR